MATQIRKISHAIRNESPPFSGYVNQLSLSAGVAASFTVPDDCDTILVGYPEGALYVRTDGGTAVIPAATVTDGTGSELIHSGSAREVSGGQVVSCIHASAIVVTIACYGAGARL